MPELPIRDHRPDLEPETVEDLVSTRCISCHTLDRVHRYKRSDWDRVIGRMRAYGAKLTEEETVAIITYLSGGIQQRDSSKKQIETPAE